MNSTSSEILNVADQLDAIGLHTEADILDRFLQRQAQGLAHREKPFFAQLAEVVLAAKNSQDIIKEKLALPLSNKSVAGLSKEQALEEVVDHGEAYIERFMGPRLEKMVDTPHEEEYRHFGKLAQSAIGTLKEILNTGKRASVREITRQIQHTQAIVNRLSFYGRDRAQTSKDLEDLQKIQFHVNSLLEALKDAVQTGDASKVGEISAQLEQIFPEQPDAQSMLYKAVGTAATDTLGSEDKKKIEQKIFDQLNEGEDTWEESLQAEILDTNIRDLKNKLEKLRVDESNIGALSIEFNRLVTEIKEHQKALKRPSSMSEEGKELAKYERETLKSPIAYQFKNWQQKSRTRIYNLTREEVRMLHEWFQDYLHSEQVTKGTTFAVYLGKKPNDLIEIFDIITRNIKSVERSLGYDIEHVSNRLKQSRDEFNLHSLQVDQIRNEHLWSVWRDQFIKKMLDVVQVSLQPQEEGGRRDMLFNTALRQFRQLLDYKL